MCGFSGIFRWQGQPVSQELLKKMTRTLVHRGPDDEGYYLDESGRFSIGLGFRRLSIIDLEGGHQPMTTERKKNWIVFNGEIYNFVELRENLEKDGVRFSTRSDTEVILRLYEKAGDDCVRYLRGMFAFAIWDADKKRLFMARDRIGKKPLFYSKTGNTLIFSSEMKAILESEEVSRRVRLDSIPLYLSYQFIPSPSTIFEQIQHLPAAHTLTCDEKGNVRTERYWNIFRTPKSRRSVREISEEAKTQLGEATKIRMSSDVPLGAFLSGGIDSSAVVGMMAQASKDPVKTFSIGFEESDFSELQFARVIADHFKTNHHEFIVKPEMTDVLPKLAWHYDQPFADPSALPSYYVARETRKFVTVALNGDGGDENFGGYLRYQADRIFHAVSRVPLPMRSLFSRLIRKASAMPDNRLMRRMLKAGSILDVSPGEFNFKLFSYFDQQGVREIFDGPLQSASGSQNVYQYFSSLYSQSDSEEFMDQILTCDAYGYLPDCLLVKMDIASMANSLEARSPFLDHKLMEFTAKIPSEYQVKMNGGKMILKDALEGFLPEVILRRRKMGFGIPLARWFQGPLKEFLRETLLDTKARQRGYFKSGEITKLIDEHQSNVRDHGYKLWALMMLELWHKVYIDKSYRFN